MARQRPPVHRPDRSRRPEANARRPELCPAPFDSVSGGGVGPMGAPGFTRISSLVAFPPPVPTSGGANGGKTRAACDARHKAARLNGRLKTQRAFSAISICVPDNQAMPREMRFPPGPGSPNARGVRLQTRLVVHRPDSPHGNAQKARALWLFLPYPVIRTAPPAKQTSL